MNMETNTVLFGKSMQNVRLKKFLLHCMLRGKIICKRMKITSLMASAFINK